MIFELNQLINELTVKLNNSQVTKSSSTTTTSTSTSTTSIAPSSTSDLCPNGNGYYALNNCTSFYECIFSGTPFEVGY